MGRHKHSSKYKSHHSSSHKRRSKEKRYHKHSRRHRRRRDESEYSSSVSNEYHSSDSESDLDIDKSLLNLTEYLDNKKELIHQVFKTLRGHKLKSMIPDELRDYSLSEIREICHEELKNMSVKNIKRLMDGEQLVLDESSSESECNEETIAKLSEYKQIDQQIADSTCDKEMDVSDIESALLKSSDIHCLPNPSIENIPTNKPIIENQQDNTGDSITDSQHANIDSYSHESLNKSKHDSSSSENVSMNQIGSRTKISFVENVSSEKSPTIQNIPPLSNTTEKSDLLDNSSQTGQIINQQSQMKGGQASHASVDNKSDTSSSPLKENSQNLPNQVTDDLETLELELRARAIRSLLKSQMRLSN